MPEARSNRVPPLAWVIAAIVILGGGYMVFQRSQSGTHVTPTGQTMAQSQSAGGDVVMPRQPTIQPGPLPPPAPNGAGPTNQPGVLSQPNPNGAPS